MSDRNMFRAKQNWSYTTVLLAVLADWRLWKALMVKRLKNELFIKMNEARIHWTTDRIKKHWEVLKAAD